jgi:hypothetical protein
VREVAGARDVKERRTRVGDLERTSCDGPKVAKGRRR